MTSKGEVSSGDALGGGVGTAQEQADMQVRVQDMVKRMGTPNKVKAAAFARQMAEIDRLFGASTKAQKEAVKDALTYLGIVHGTGPNVRWEDISCEPEGCKEVMMNLVVDRIVTRQYHRRFMTNYSQRAVIMFNSSPEIQGFLTERAVRNGIPITEAMSVIDFLDSSSGVSPGVLAMRVQSKYSAVARANNNSKNSVERSAGNAAGAMHGYNNSGDADSLGDL